ncbi:MAG: hypothetical protein MI784_13490 [Cytophagales bacterium]|nr:hypothetical protein [Cytophagales bacterium]
MIYKDSKGNLIGNRQAWKDCLFLGKKARQWKKGRSAYELADFMMNQSGEKEIARIISDILQENVVFEHAIPEMEVRFDEHGHGREHDLGILAERNPENAFLLELNLKWTSLLEIAYKKFT